MKFELAPYNWGLSDDVLLDDLRAVAHKLGKASVTKEEYNKLGRLSASALQKRFGSWCKAHELAGLHKNRNYDATAEDCINDLKVVAAKLGKTTMAFSEYQPLGRYNLTLISRRCGSFRSALERAGLAPSPLAREKLTDEQLFENLEHLWEALGRQPTRDDYFKPLSRYSYTPYIRRFGSYRKALEAFVASVEAEPAAVEEESLIAVSIDTGPLAPPVRHKTSRSVSWRMKFLVMQRDGFKCRFCGAAPTLKPGTVLVIDHMKPWESGGETVIENLQTLCEPCNGGKSNLPLVEG